MQARTQGPGRVIFAMYVVFVIGSVSRATFQIITEFSVAPLAYTLSAIAAAIYVVATVSLAFSGPRAWWVSMVTISIELAGVLIVGTWSDLAPQSFPDATVWSNYGQGYLFIPVILPIIGLWWLLKNRPESTKRSRR
ncbi:hypothetical protein K0651_11945 [Ornithinimicrobium sp. Arc0846-15]|nr:hypothetical protein [Ornithinimicrobium laminariae]